MRLFFAYVFCCLLWGSTWLFIKLGLRDLPPLTFAAARMTLAAAVLLPFAARARFAGLRRPDWIRIAAVGLLQIGAPYALLFAGQQWVTSGLAAVLFATFPVWLLLLARALLPGQPLTAPKIAAALLGIAGVGVLQAPALRQSSLGAQAALGGVLIVAAAMLVALANVLIRRLLAHHVPVVLTFVQVASGALLLILVAGLLEHGRVAVWTPRAGAAVAYLAVCSSSGSCLASRWPRSAPSRSSTRPSPCSSAPSSYASRSSPRCSPAVRWSSPERRWRTLPEPAGWRRCPNPDEPRQSRMRCRSNRSARQLSARTIASRSA